MLLLVAGVDGELSLSTKRFGEDVWEKLVPAMLQGNE
jgi:hypothetical protein